MNLKSKLCDANHWRGRAEATRTKAESLAFGKSRDRLLKIAEEYDKLARRAQEWQSNGSDGEPESSQHF
ncbi:hypothetical protein AS156_06690 [Bradyrhizobium macuxiense]|uniref:Uncharacterized protein n=1 Tax=Bradyrhizobium macuxiense TaxID=1755647 RepID=A0A109JT65_9BRAD|nr:hypothetical protein AS156_06690 [Bradyrhizobium macuxiense]